MEFREGFKIQATQSLVLISIIESCDSFYETSSSFQKPGAAMGYGKKSDFTKDLTSSPGSSKYDLKTIFDHNRKSNKGFSISLSRDVFMRLKLENSIERLHPFRSTQSSSSEQVQQHER